MGAPTLPKQDALPELTADRLDRRRSLLDRLDDTFERANSSAGVARMDRAQQRAFSLLTSAAVRDAFDLAREPGVLRDRYGRNLFGSSLLVARRLVEAGVPFVSVHAENFIPHGFTYDSSGACVLVPSQEHVPYGARVASHPVREEGRLVESCLSAGPEKAERRQGDVGAWARRVRPDENRTVRRSLGARTGSRQDLEA